MFHNHIPWGRHGQILVFLAAGLVAGSGLAGTMTVTLDDVTVDTCGEVWHEIGLPIWFTETTEDDPYPGLCVVDPDANSDDLEGVFLGPARLMVNVGSVEGLDLVYLDVHINSGSAFAFMYRGDEHLYTNGIGGEGDHLLTLPAFDGDTVILRGDNLFVWEIRLDGSNLVVAEPVSFGSLKVQYGH